MNEAIVISLLDDLDDYRLISRAEAKQAINNRYQERIYTYILDFRRVDEISPSFADQIIRVEPLKKNIIVFYTNANEGITKKIDVAFKLYQKEMIERYYASKRK